MNDDKSIMKFEATLPEDFDGVFRFTNWSDEDFVGVWGGQQYHFPAQSTSPMIIPEHSPLEIQHIRKKFAKDLAEREFTKTAEHNRLLSQERNPDGSARLNSIHQAGAYNLEQLTPLIQRCLEPLKITNAKVTKTPKVPLEDTLTRDDDGNLVTEAVDKKASLREKALRA
jgi:hypothetical protein